MCIEGSLYKNINAGTKQIGTGKYSPIYKSPSIGSSLKVPKR